MYEVLSSTGYISVTVLIHVLTSFFHEPNGILNHYSSSIKKKNVMLNTWMFDKSYSIAISILSHVLSWERLVCS